jgi:hypothetical protein
MDPLCEAEGRLRSLCEAMTHALEACEHDFTAGGPPASREEAQLFDAAKMKLSSYEAVERARLAPAVAQLLQRFGELHGALGGLVEAPAIDMENAIAALEAEDAAVDRRLVELYATAAELDDVMHEAIEANTLDAFRKKT